MHNQILEGTWADVSKKAAQLRGDVQVRLEVIEHEGKGEMIKLGMFQGLGKISERDFKAAEWSDPKESL